MKPRMGYKELRPVIAINILNFTIFDQTERFHTTYHLYEDKEIAGFSIINDFNKQFSPNMKGHITIEELEKWLKWRTFPPTRANVDKLLACKHIIAGALLEKRIEDDEIWLRVEGVELRRRDVCLRKDLYYSEETSFAE